MVVNVTMGTGTMPSLVGLCSVLFRVAKGMRLTACRSSCMVPLRDPVNRGGRFCTSRIWISKLCHVRNSPSCKYKTGMRARPHHGAVLDQLTKQLQILHVNCSFPLYLFPPDGCSVILSGKFSPVMGPGTLIGPGYCTTKYTVPQGVLISEYSQRYAM